MALTTCRECGKKISTAARSCPGCGWSNPRLRRRVVAPEGDYTMSTIFGVIGLIIPIFSIAAIMTGKRGKTGHTLGIIGLVLLGLVILVAIARAGRNRRVDFDYENRLPRQEWICRR